MSAEIADYLEHLAKERDVSPNTVRAYDRDLKEFIAFLGRLDAIYGPGAGRPDKPVVFVLDNGPIHTSKASRAALAARDWLTIEWLPKYAPELNDIERSWRDLKRHFLGIRPSPTPIISTAPSIKALPT